jgi:hypothetical protein
MSGAWNGRTREAERLAAQAWDELVAAIESGGAGARAVARRTADLADEAGDRLGSSGERIGSVAAESRRRAGAALDALAGRRRPVPWEWVVGGVLAGALAGWVGGVLIRRAAARSEPFDAVNEEFDTHQEQDKLA